ncbi:uncharacterized protein C1orf53 homolog [Cololabis saira]|uniref:uncharacterized protein C1orf53 homolog n=1 Tax=Cololabis saira TaxID=129043 RepID=UPI002AD22C76|nr:uncharacterized protein C1orf53 homolog [Cololabis saira]
MFHKNYPCKAFCSRLMITILQLNKRLITMSVRKCLEERNPKRLSNELRTGGGTAALRDAEPETCGAHRVTEEEMAIHVAHRRACEAKQQMYRDPSTGYKVFTEYAHLQRGRCCGSACRHCPHGQVNVKDPAMKKRFNSLFYV